ncbi:hypothetical protein JTE90_005380 [Oedothorax gibbosus]|uniref:Uncharacterized protein n=1 Tax=Oedothorax gibbosus TaxID=931172 RepID=A0AAV6TE15_9ARAC|nr:hypothetical protein JTE90_005380 [Oedothorax gibbosus]
MPREKRLYSSIRLSTDSSEVTDLSKSSPMLDKGTVSEWINNYRVARSGLQHHSSQRWLHMKPKKNEE